MKPDFDLSQLSPAECILLAEELWDRARAHPDTILVPQEHLDEITRRIDALDNGTMEAGADWEIVRTRLWGQ